MSNLSRKTSVVVIKTQGRGVYIKVYNRYNEFFMGTPLSISLPNEPLAEVFTNEDDFKNRHTKWEVKCKDKISTYLHTAFNVSLYGELSVEFKGFEPYNEEEI